MIDVVAGIIRQGNKVLIARRASHKLLGGKWEFPGGKIEKNEKPELALERELFEEFNITTKTGSLFHSTEYANAGLEIKLIAYFSYYINGSFQLTDHDQITWVPIEQLPTYDFAEADKPIVSKLIEIFGRNT